MRFIGWMYDIAREQSPKEPILRDMLSRSLNAGYNAVGFYLEHRFVYKTAPWAAGPGALQPDLVRKMIGEFPDLRLIPFLNVLGHMEGFIRSEGGQWLSEGPSPGSQQMCPSRKECVDFARGLISDALEVFTDEWVHLGGDETTQLGQCALCAERAESVGKAGIYEDYFVPLCEWLVSLGKRPCIWGDMLLEHPSVLERLPKQTIIFDWQYWDDPSPSTQKFLDAGFEVVCCPSVHTYDSGWCYLDLTHKNIDDHKKCASDLNALGVLVTTWEFSFFTNYASTMPVIYSAGRRLANAEEWQEALSREGGEGYAKAAQIMGNDVPNCSEFLKAPGWRRLRDSFIIRQNPFYLWQDWREEACGQVGDHILRLCEESERYLDENSPLLSAIALHKIAIEFVRLAESCYVAYKQEGAWPKHFRIESVKLLTGLYAIAQHCALHGGSLADPFRAMKLMNVADGPAHLFSTFFDEVYANAIHRPSFEVVTHEAFIPGDQAAWRTGQYR